MLLSSISLALTRLCQRLGRWSPLSLWPDGIATPGMWISPRDLTSQWADYTGTTPVATPGTVADSSNPVGMSLDIRAGATVLTDPGNHMLQSTSVDRPLLSARVNLLTYTEDFSDAVWTKVGCTPTNNYGVAPDGTTTAARLLFSGGGVLIAQTLSTTINTSNYGLWIKGVVGETVLVTVNTIENPPLFTFTGAWQQYEISDSLNPVDRLVISTYLSATARDVLVWHPQISIGTTALPYQRVTSASDYDATDFPIAQLYNGTNSGMATAAFAAGTLTSGMDCMIAVRRDSDAQMVLGLYETAGGGIYFGAAEGPSGAYPSCTSAGTPTIWVDGVQLAGGTAVTALTVDTAVTPGDWHIVEFRDLDLSAWVGASFGKYGNGYNVVGPRGDILLYPSTASTEDKDAARQWLADYYGVTLP